MTKQSTTDGVPARHAHGPTLPTTPEWRAAIRSAIAQRGLTQKQIAVAIGVSQGVISQVTSEPPRNTSSDIVAPLSRFLNVPLPLVPLTSALIGELYEHASSLLDEDEEALRELVESARNMRRMIARHRGGKKK